MNLPKSKYFKIAIWILVIFTIILVGSHISFIFDPIVFLGKMFFLPIILSIIFYYLFSPLVTLLEKYKLNRTLAVILIYLCIITLFILLVVVMGPSLVKQVSDFIDYFPKLIEDLMGVFHSISKSNLFQRFNIEEFISDNSVSEWSSDFATEILPQIGMGFSSAVTFLVNTTLGFVLMPIMLFYMLKDGKKFSKLLIKRFPDSLKEDAILIMKDMDEGLSSFIQGQVIVSMSVGTLLYIGFLIIGVDYPLILALIAMLTNFIPSIGPVLGTIPAIIVAISISPFMVLKVIALVVVVQQLESLFISPQVIGRKLSIHPLLIIFILIIAGYLAGFLGLLFAVPTYVILKVIIEHIIRLYKLKKASQ